MPRIPIVLASLAAAAAGLALAGVGASADTGPTPTGPNVGTRPAAIVYRPPGLSTAQPVPLVIALYGATGCPQCMEGLTHFEAVADQHGFVVAYPGSVLVNTVPWTQQGDIPYISSLITQLERDPSENIDPNRVYVAGFSAGGRFAFQLGCALSRQITAIAVVSSTQRPYACRLSHPVSELTIAGSTETSVVAGNARMGVASAATIEGWWRSRDGCTQAPTSSKSPPMIEQITTGCVDGSRVGLYILQGGHHTWPGCPCNLPVTDPDRQWNASQGIWAFFSGLSTGSLTTPTASLAKLHVTQRRGQRYVQQSFSLGEQVSVHERLSAGRRSVGSTTASLSAGGRVGLALKVSKHARAGAAKLIIRITDRYGRKLTLTRRLRIR
jgi:polyhydroxybutyrate depolymerase